MSASRRADALVAAAETLDALAIDQSAIIDPFAAIDQLGLALNITKLDNLLGAVIPQGDGGVLITSERSPAIQRYTAAHEIGHWILHGHELRMDRETEVLGRPSSEMEREAQLFAGYFLMPPPLLNQAIAAYDLRLGGIHPEHVYRLSRDLDVSYEASARRLYMARLIDSTALTQILNLGRMSAMQRASAGHRPSDGLADVWDATSDEEVVRLVVEEHDEVIVGFDEQRLAGWRWMTAEELARRNSGPARPLQRPVAPAASPETPNRYLGETNNLISRPTLDARAALEPHRAPDFDPGDSDLRRTEPPAGIVEDTFEARGERETPAQRRRRRTARARGRSSQVDDHMDTAEPRIGGNCVRTIVIRAAVPGEWNLQLYYAHAYDPRDEPLLTYELRLRIQPTPTTAFRARRLKSDLDQRLPGDPDDREEFEVDAA
ncbi:MAG: ImmA/IrrE family metallo-endopeptidase [Streptosporangiaceae bacterium]